VDVAIATSSVPPAWFESDELLATMVEILEQIRAATDRAVRKAKAD
jgi:hypothetical protein